MFDRFNRTIDYLRISVTDRCNHRCVYCMPAAGVPLKRHDQILSYEQIEAFTREAVALGIRKVRLTGGEPLIRRDIETLVGRLARIDGLDELCMTTNGTLLAGKAAVLRANGLDRVNISIDTLDPRRYREITRGGDLNEALAGLEAARAAGLTPIKINMVITAETTEADVEAMRRFCENEGVGLQKIMQFSLYDRHDLNDHFHTERPPKCPECNRLRLTADGFLKPCLFSEDEVSVDFGHIRQSILDAVALKPESGSSCRTRPMYQIGG
ncbi:MAG: radical SAM protein [Kiritimatiellae bacterium]|nr:radical SAM protein [Kiritimatiellia bacterium]